MTSAVTVGGARSRLAVIVAGAIAGAVFGAGLLLSGMTDPAKVVGFLRPCAGWDPSLAFVMGGAVLVYAAAFHLGRRARPAPLFDATFHLPTRRDIDVGLMAGAALFGAGWGLAGFCPGPGLIAAASGSSSGLLFAGAMVLGMLAQHGWSRR